eukprot:gene12953-13082_t
MAASSSGAVSQLMGLVVLPTRDLAVQVYAVLQQLAAAAGIRIVLAAAQEPVPAEAAKLVERPSRPGSGPQLLVATPGRLIAHLHSTAGFNLRALRFLVVDEADRLDPSKLLRLGLHNPRFFTLMEAGRRYALPALLHQHKLVVPVQHKPLALLALLHHLAGSTVLVFASSLETTHRLFLLLAAVPELPDKVAEYSSLVAAEQRAAALAAFRSGQVKVLVTSDAMTRGMDVPNVANVVNYDPPSYPKTYIHRAGRTARAGSTGSVYTLLKPEDVVHFNALVSKLRGRKVATMKLQPAQLQPFRPAVHQALQQVNQQLDEERRQQQQQQKQVPASHRKRSKK